MRVELVQDRKRLAPVALAAEEPVAQLVVDLALAAPALGQPFGDLLLEVRGGQTVERPGVDGRAFAAEAVREQLEVPAIQRLGHLDGVLAEPFPH